MLFYLFIIFDLQSPIDNIVNAFLTFFFNLDFFTVFGSRLAHFGAEVALDFRIALHRLKERRPRGASKRSKSGQESSKSGQRDPRGGINRGRGVARSGPLAPFCFYFGLSG